MKILVAIDFSDITQTVLEHAIKLAQVMQAETVLLHAAEPNPDQIAYDYDPAATYAIEPGEIRKNIAERFHREHQKIQQYADQIRQQNLDCKALMIQGPTVDVILNEAKKLGSDFIIAGTHGKGVISQILLGSTSTDLVKNSLIPVYLVPASPSE